MALTKEQQEIVTKIAAGCSQEADRTVLAELLARNETAAKALEEGYLRQSDYDRNLNKFKLEIAARENELTASIEKYEQAHQKNTEWYEQNKPLLDKGAKFDSTVAGFEQKLREAAARVSGGEGGEVKPEEVKKMVDDAIATAGGQITPEAINKLVLDAANRIAAEKQQEFINNTLPLQTKFTLDMGRVDRMHEKEFGKPMDENEFSAFAAAHPKATFPDLQDPLKMFEAYAAPKREALATEKKLREDLQKEFDEKAQKLRDEYSGGVPGSGAQPLGEKGALQARLEEGKDAKTVGGGYVAAAAEARAAGRV